MLKSPPRASRTHAIRTIEEIPAPAADPCSAFPRGTTPSLTLKQDAPARQRANSTASASRKQAISEKISQGKLEANNYGRDHHGRCFTMWLAGGGVRPGMVHGETDDYSYNIVRDPVHVHDLNATILDCLGIDHTRLTYRFQGRDFRLTDVHGRVILL